MRDGTQNEPGGGPPVTVIGLGPMGTALAAAFVEKGHRTTVWNRTAPKAAPLVAQGAELAPTAADAVGASPLTVVCVIDYDAVHAILDPVAGELRGRTVVNLSADAPDRAREMGEWAAGRGIDYIDGSIMTTTVTIGRPEAVFLYSGPEEVYQRHRPTLSSLGGTATHVGADIGRAAAYDVALLDIFWTAMSGVVHAFALARAEGIEAGELTPFAQGIIEVATHVTADLANSIDARRYSDPDSTLTSNAAGMQHIIHASETHGIDASVLSAARAIADRAIAAGHGSDDFARLVEVLAGDR